VTIVGYIAYTLIATEWRLKYRREMNDSDSDRQHQGYRQPAEL
jgi:ABC-type transport system involved in Fe-S cluster assembly fused permease/ATPase subunit